MIDIKLLDGADEFRPGGTISGSVEWSNLRPRTSGIEIRLVWETTGKGATDTESVASHTVEAVSASGTAEFQFQVPTRPFSFSGKLISLGWVVEAREDPRGEDVRIPITISNDGKEIMLRNSYDSSELKKAAIDVKATR